MTDMEELIIRFIFGNAVLRKRLEKGWSQTELARRVRSKQATILAIESGQGNPRLDFVIRLCNYLGIDVNFRTEDL